MGRKAQKGDVLKVDHAFYAHYGVYTERGTVIHYTDANGSDFKGMVQETDLSSFLNGETSYTVCEFNPKDFSHIYSPEETVMRARTKIGQGGYNFFTHNCEHFAVWCKTGKYESSQVNGFSPSNIADGIYSFFESLFS